MSILNSISRGFGFSIGRRMADNVMNGIGKSNGVYKESPSLTGGQIFKTILWGFAMLFLATFIVSLYFAFTSPINSKPDFGKMLLPIFLLGSFFTYVIGRGYYNDNKKVIESVNTFREVQAEKERLTKETEDLYIGEKITKREYEILMKRINKM